MFVSSHDLFVFFVFHHRPMLITRHLFSSLALPLSVSLVVVEDDAGRSFVSFLIHTKTLFHPTRLHFSSILLFISLAFCGHWLSVSGISSVAISNMNISLRCQSNESLHTYHQLSFTIIFFVYVFFSNLFRIVFLFYPFFLSLSISFFQVPFASKLFSSAVAVLCISRSAHFSVYLSLLLSAPPVPSHSSPYPLPCLPSFLTSFVTCHITNSLSIIIALTFHFRFQRYVRSSLSVNFRFCFGPSSSAWPLEFNRFEIFDKHATNVNFSSLHSFISFNFLFIRSKSFAVIRISIVHVHIFTSLHISIFGLPFARRLNAISPISLVHSILPSSALSRRRFFAFQINPRFQHVKNHSSPITRHPFPSARSNPSFPLSAI